MKAENWLDAAVSLDRAGLTFFKKGDPLRAAALFQEACTLREKHTPWKENPEMADGLALAYTNLALPS